MISLVENFYGNESRDLRGKVFSLVYDGIFRWRLSWNTSDSFYFLFFIFDFLFMCIVMSKDYINIDGYKFIFNKFKKKLNDFIHCMYNSK